MDFESIARLRKYLQVKHSLPGRLRLKFTRTIMQDKEALALAESGLEPPAAVSRIKVNMFSRTVLIEYDHKKIPFGLIEKLVQAKTDSEAAIILKKFHALLY